MMKNGDDVIVIKADGAVGGYIAFAVVGDHENRVTDMTNLVIAEEEENEDGRETDIRLRSHR